MNALNEAFEQGLELPDTLWEEWLWETDPQEPAELLNKNHLIGLLLARFRGRHRSHLANCIAAFPNIVHQSTNVAEFTLKHVRDQLDDLQLHWGVYVLDIEGCHELLDALMTQFGRLCEQPKHDDSESVEPDGSISVSALRHFLSIFLVLYRHLWLWSKSHEYKVDTTVMLNKYHVEASTEMFDTHSMIAQLPPAARLLYMQDFKGMYHNLSQVVYFHFPDYDAPLQLPIEDLQRGETYHALAPLYQLYPDIPVLMEDEVPTSKCFILIGGGHVFLWLDKDTIVSNRSIFSSVEIPDEYSAPA